MASGSSLEQLRQRYGATYRWRVLFTVMVGTMAAMVASTIVNVAVPDLSRHFRLNQAQAQWVSAGFMVAVTMSMLLTPWLLRRFGLRRTYSGAIAVLAIGALIGGLAQHFSVVLAMRAVEGLAAGVLQPLPAVVILRAFDERERGRAMGIFGFGVVLAPAVGPTVGGLLVDAFGWRAIFFVMLPLGAIGLALARRYLPVPELGGEKPPADWLGLVLLGIATLGLLNGLIEIQEDGAGTGLVLLALSAIAVAGFFWRQVRAHSPLLNLRLFDSGPFAAGAMVAFVYGMALFGSTYLVPIFLQIGLQYRATEAGLVLLPAGLVLALAMPITGRLADRFPAHRLVVLGLLILAVSFALLATVSAQTLYVQLMLWVIVGRVGLALVMPALSLGAMYGIGRDSIAEGTSTINFVRQLGGAVGVSLAGIALEWRMAAHGVTLHADGIVAPDRIRAFDETFVGVASVCVLAALIARRLRPPPPTPAARPDAGSG